MKLFKTGRNLEEHDLINRIEAINEIHEEFKDNCSKPLSDRDLLESIYRELIKIRLKLETL